MSQHVNQELNQSINKAMLISKAFIAWNIAFFITSLILKNTIADDAVGSVLLRGGFYAIAGLILVYLLRQMAQGKRSAWLRLAVISILAPLGTAAFITFTPHLPMWFDAGQVGSALMLLVIASVIWRQDVRKHFPKTT